MIRKLMREFFLLTRGEQRAMIMVSVFLILSLGVRIFVQMLPQKEAPGMELFMEESRQILSLLAEADSIKEVKKTARQRQRSSASFYTGSKESSGVISINSADSADLLPLPGIGPVFAGRIIKYRNLLGGFVSSANFLKSMDCQMKPSFKSHH